jgi:hypothetical protein
MKGLCISDRVFLKGCFELNFDEQCDAVEECDATPLH